MFTRTPKGWARPFEAESYRGITLAEPLVDADTGEVVAEAGAKLTQRTARKIAEKTKHRAGRAGPSCSAATWRSIIVNEETGEIYAEAGEEIGGGAADRSWRSSGSPSCRRSRSIRRTGRGCATRSRWTRTAIATMRWSISTGSCGPGEPPTPETAEALFRGLFFDARPL